MQFDSFQKQIDRLRGVYSPTSLNQERVAVLWERFKNVSDAQFHGAVTFLIGEFTTQALPGMSRFEEAVARFKSQTRQDPTNQQEREIQYTCAPCRDWGFVWDGELIVHCKCKLAKTLTWEDLRRHQENYDRGKRFMPREKLAALMKAAQERRTGA